MKILLAYISGAPDRRDRYLNLLPTGLCTMHACLRDAGFDAVLANYSGWSKSAVAQHVADLKPDFFGISQWTHNRHASLELAHSVRSAFPSCLIVLGGGHATFSCAEILTEESPVDCVVLGEGEETVLELARCVDGGTPWQMTRGISFRRAGRIVRTESRPYLTDLDRLPSGVKFLEHSVGVDMQLQSEFIITARGCPSSCRFCSSPDFWGRRVRFRSPENIVDEILNIRKKFGLIYFSFRDDTFTVDRNRTIEFCRLLIERRAYILWNCQSRVTALDDELLTWMKRAGCECIQLGVESGSPTILSLLGKGISPDRVEAVAGQIKKVGISLSIFLISDIPGENEEDLQQTFRLIERIQPDDGYVSPLAYYPGTRLFEDAVECGRAGRAIFREQTEPAIFASGRNRAGSKRVLRHLASVRSTGASAAFLDQKKLLGYCFATNVLAGEYCRQAGDTAAAEREFLEITKKEADNPWGWYLLAELYRETGRMSQARECFREVCDIVPEHGPSRDALKAGTKKKRGR